MVATCGYGPMREPRPLPSDGRRLEGKSLIYLIVRGNSFSDLSISLYLYSFFSLFLCFCFVPLRFLPALRFLPFSLSLDSLAFHAPSLSLSLSH